MDRASVLYHFGPDWEWWPIDFFRGLGMLPFSLFLQSYATSDYPVLVHQVIDLKVEIRASLVLKGVAHLDLFKVEPRSPIQCSCRLTRLSWLCVRPIFLLTITTSQLEISLRYLSNQFRNSSCYDIYTINCDTISSSPSLLLLFHCLYIGI